MVNKNTTHMRINKDLVVQISELRKQLELRSNSVVVKRAIEAFKKKK